MNRQKNKTYRWLAVLLVCAAACSKEAPQTAPPLPLTSRLMVILADPYGQAMDFRAVYADTFRINKQPVTYPGLLQYTSVPSGTRWLFAQLSGTSAGSLFPPGYYFKPGVSYTYVWSKQYNARIEDDLTMPAAGYANLRVLQVAGYSRKIDCIIHNGDTLSKGMKYLFPTGFMPVKAGSYQLDLRDSEAPHTYKISLQTRLEAGRIYTLLVTGIPAADTSRVLMGAQLIINK